MRRLALFAAAGIAVVGFAGTASAHHPEISATVRCEAEGDPTVSITATSWATPNQAARHNNNVVIAIDGVTVRSGAFTATNGYTFTVRVPVTVGVHTARATAVVGFGPSGEFGSAGEWRETQFRVPDNCAPVPPTTTVTTTSRPPTTTLSTPTTVTTTVPPVSVQASSAKVVTQPTRLADTGGVNWSLVVGGVLALALGLFATALHRRRFS
jgi:hypothetical protein